MRASPSHASIQAAAASALLALTFAASSAAASTANQPSIGANPVFNAMPAAAEGRELIVTDLVLPPDAAGDAHYHPWEEYLYVISGSAMLGMDGAEPSALAAGDTAIIPARTIHTPKAGPDGVRAIVIRLHMAGDPASIPAPPAPPAPPTPPSSEPVL